MKINRICTETCTGAGKEISDNWNMKKQEEITYETAWNELQQIVAELQAESVSVDQLAEKVERAAALVAFCRTRLRQTEEKLDQLTG